MARRPWTHDQLVAGVRAGDRRAVARAISLVESRDAAAPGAAAGAVSGDRLGLRGRDHRAARRRQVVADRGADHARSRARPDGRRDLDRSRRARSRHGALLGDRIRLSEHFLDPGVFIRSMGSPWASRRAGRDHAAVPLAPRRRRDGRRLPRDRRSGAERGRGDERRRRGRARPDAGLGRLGAGAEGRDHGDPGRDRGQQDGSAGCEGVAERHPGRDRPRSRTRPWRPPIVLTEALRGEGVDTLWSAIVERRDALAADGELEQRRRGNLAGEVVAAATARARGEIERAIAEDSALAELVASVQRREVDPLTAADRVASAVLREATS